jgi:acyl dehydratase
MTSQALRVGDELTGPVRAITVERIEWYDSALLSACTNELRQVGVNIHTDAEFAKGEGLVVPIADGMISTNWCSEMLISQFGIDYVSTGELRTKFIKPVNLGVLLHVKGRVKEATPQPNGATLYLLDVWCEDSDGRKLVDGDARVEVPAR